MDYQKHNDIMNDLVSLVRKHGISLMISQKDDSKFKQEYDGFSVFFTDGTPSKERIKRCSVGEYPTSITVQLIRYKKS